MVPGWPLGAGTMPAPLPHDTTGAVAKSQFRARKGPPSLPIRCILPLIGKGGTHARDQGTAHLPLAE